MLLSSSGLTAVWHGPTAAAASPAVLLHLLTMKVIVNTSRSVYVEVQQLSEPLSVLLPACPELLLLSLLLLSMPIARDELCSDV
jgi:hypothetical protein